MAPCSWHAFPSSADHPASPPCRRQAAPVCRRWLGFADHPALLEEVEVSFVGEDWAQRYLAFAMWLPPRAAHVRQLSVTATAGTAHRRAPSDEESAYAAEATTGLLAACAGAGQLTSLSLDLDASFQQWSWLPGLRSLRSLEIASRQEAAVWDPLIALASLEDLSLAGWPLEVPDELLLPSSLTELSLSYITNEFMPDQVGCPAPAAAGRWPVVH